MSEEQTVSLVDVLEEDEELEEEASAVLAGSDPDHCSYPQVGAHTHHHVTCQARDVITSPGLGLQVCLWCSCELVFCLLPVWKPTSWVLLSEQLQVIEPYVLIKPNMIMWLNNDGQTLNLSAPQEKIPDDVFTVVTLLWNSCVVVMCVMGPISWGGVSVSQCSCVCVSGLREAPGALRL